MSYVTPDLGFAGSSIAGRAITETLYVSPNGNNSDGSSWIKAFNTIQAALAAASVDADDLTLILVGPHATYYDIDTTGDPTYTGNYEIKGSHRNWAKIQNDHVSATAIMKFTGKISLQDLTFDCDSSTNNGVIFSGSGTKGLRIRKVHFECGQVTGAQTAIEISGGVEHARFEDVMIHGVVTHTRGLLLDDVTLSDYESLHVHECLTGIQIINTDSDENRFNNLDIHSCALALDIDEGNGQIFTNLILIDNILNIDDEVGDHFYNNINAQSPIMTEPDNFTGIAVDTGNGAGTWTVVPVEVRSAVSATKPFRIVSISLEAGTSEKYRFRMIANGITFVDFQFEGVALGSQSESLNFTSNSDFIFNKGTAVTAQSKSESGGIDELDVWLEIQEI